MCITGPVAFCLLGDRFFYAPWFQFSVTGSLNPMDNFESESRARINYFKVVALFGILYAIFMLTPVPTSVGVLIVIDISR